MKDLFILLYHAKYAHRRYQYQTIIYILLTSEQHRFLSKTLLENVIQASL